MLYVNFQYDMMKQLKKNIKHVNNIRVNMYTYIKEYLSIILNHSLSSFLTCGCLPRTRASGGNKSLTGGCPPRSKASGMLKRQISMRAFRIIMQK